MPRGFKNDGTKLGFKKGNIPWIKGQKIILSANHKLKISAALKGRKLSKEHKRKLSIFFKENPPKYWLGKKKTEEQKDKIKGEHHGMWKGDKVKNGALHIWVKSRKFKPSFCENCCNASPYDLANISSTYNSKTYTRDLNNWQWLCRHCHMLKDGRLEKISRETILRNAENKRRKLNNHQTEEN